MEVSGRKNVTQDLGEEKFMCQPCGEDGNILPAHGYCTDCEEYLCKVCYNGHLLPRPSRHHKLLHKSEMPKEIKVKSWDECTELCREHRGKTVEYYCTQHDQLGCGPCMTTRHRSCDEAVQFIPDVSMGTSKSEQCHAIQKKLESMKGETSDIKKKVKVNTGSIAEVSDDAANAVAAFRNEIKTFFDQLENNILEQLDVKRAENLQKMKTVSEKCDKTENQIEFLTLDINNKVRTKRENQLFVTLKHAEKKILLHEKELKQARENVKFEKFEFIPNEMAVNMMKTLSLLGKIVIKQDCRQKVSESWELGISSDFVQTMQKSDTKTDDTTSINITCLDSTQVPTATTDCQTRQHGHNSKIIVSPRVKSKQQVVMSTKNITSGPVQQASSDAASQPSTAANIDKPVCINISHQPDNEQCDITDMTVLSDGRLVLADCYNKCIKILDQNYKVVSHVPLPSSPWGIAKVGEDQLAVTMPDASKIQFMSVSGHLVYQINTTGMCYGIVHIPDKLIVGVNWQVKVLDMKGKVLKVMLCGHCEYLAISPDHTILYVSGKWRSTTVTSLTLEGMVLANYKDDDLHYSRGLTVDRAGRVYVCGRKSNNIHQLTGYCTKVQVLYQGEVSDPTTIAYSDRENKLYVGSRTYIKMFQLQ